MCVCFFSGSYLTFSLCFSMNLVHPYGSSVFYFDFDIQFSANPCISVMIQSFSPILLLLSSPLPLLTAAGGISFSDWGERCYNLLLSKCQNHLHDCIILEDLTSKYVSSMYKPISFTLFGECLPFCFCFLFFVRFSVFGADTSC